MDEIRSIRASSGRLSRSVVRGGRGLFAALAVTLCCVSVPAAPGDVSKFPINDDNPSASIPSLEERNAAPMQFGYFLQDLYTSGQLAFEKKDWARSTKYFEAIVKIISDRALTFSRLCEAYQHLGNVDAARANCAKAISLPGATWVDHARFLELSLDAKTLKPSDVADIDASIAHVREQFVSLPAVEVPAHEEVKPLASGAPPDAASRTLADIKEAQRERREAKQTVAQRAQFMLHFEGLACRFALRLRDAKRLDRCVAELKQQKAEERVVLTFEWAKAVIVRDRKGSLALLERAKELTIPDATLAAMAREHEDTFGLVALLKRYKIVEGVVLSLVVIGGGLLVWMRRRRRPTLPASRPATAGEPAAS